MSGTPCPQCGFIVPQDFGVATCPNCQNVFMVQMDSGTSAENISQESQLNSLTSPASPTTPAPDFQDDLLTDAPLIPESENEISAKSVMADIQAFGNSETPPSPISYNLKIAGLERHDLRKRLFEIFSEARLNFRSDVLIKSIRNGELEIKNINPVKVSVLISRLRELPVKLSWTQGLYEVAEDTDLTRVPLRTPGEV